MKIFNVINEAKGYIITVNLVEPTFDDKLIMTLLSR